MASAPFGEPLPAYPVEDQPSWLRRNLKWIVPTGCGCMLVLVAGGIVGLALVVLSLLKSNDAYRIALETARAHPEVKVLLGEPIEAGWLVKGSINFADSSAWAKLEIPVSGPKGSGTLHCVAYKEAGRWHFQKLHVEIEGRAEPIDLLDGGASRESE